MVLLLSIFFSKRMLAWDLIFPYFFLCVLGSRNFDLKKIKTFGELQLIRKNTKVHNADNASIISDGSP